MSLPLIEVRVITYKRPALLRRALGGLCNQTYTNWKAIVYDDSPEAEAFDVVARMRDDRIICRPNAKNLGAALNLCQAFGPEPLVESSVFACVLEDDNYFEPTLLERNVEVLTSVPEPVLARNFRMVDIQADGTVAWTPGEPLRTMYGGQSKVLSYRDRVREAFFTFTIGNLSYFWRFNVGVNLSALEPYNASLSEPRRAVNFRQDCRYEPEALSVFGRFVCKDQSPRIGEATGGSLLHRLSHLSQIYFTQDLKQRWTQDLRQPIDLIVEEARSRAGGTAALYHLAETGLPSAILALRPEIPWRRLLKTVPLRLAYAHRYGKDRRSSLLWQNDLRPQSIELPVTSTSA